MEEISRNHTLRCQRFARETAVGSWDGVRTEDSGERVGAVKICNRFPEITGSYLPDDYRTIPRLNRK